MSKSSKSTKERLQQQFKKQLAEKYPEEIEAIKNMNEQIERLNDRLATNLDLAIRHPLGFKKLQGAASEQRGHIDDEMRKILGVITKYEGLGLASFFPERVNQFKVSAQLYLQTAEIEQEVLEKIKRASLAEADASSLKKGSEKEKQ